ncbi:MAG TPA: YqeG family HAD IIIA-type phosphatase [Firmicutes bacterium]|jgi:HAD superfamily phosphatase (TIGR01668 family)|nr:YqeG family HAD IIIA-type phosphatase [Bacillota bacterium]HAA38257.1 YqeG family HAD IIIA-type phosphatase [Bacillota bacterium]
MKLLQPNEMVDSIYDINLSSLKAKGIKGIITDMDNTLLAWHSSEITPTAAQWVNEVRQADLKIAIVSNNSPARVEELSAQLGVICIAKAVKPRRSAFRSIAAQFNLSPQEMAVVGDQLFTDVLGGNRAGMYTILVNPISKHEFIGTKIMRLLEKLFLQR